MRPIDLIWAALFGALLALIFTAIGHSWGYSISELKSYRECRAVASIEVCVKHSRIEKSR